MLLAYMLIAQIPAQFIISMLLLGHTISIKHWNWKIAAVTFFYFWGPPKPVDAKWSHAQKCTFQHNIQKIKVGPCFGLQSKHTLHIQYFFLKIF